jgi:uncharacterized protein
MYFEIYGEMRKLLGQLEKWLDASIAFAKGKSFEPNTLLQARLAPDQFPLVRQVQIACDTAKLTASQLTGKAAPSHPDTEQTIDELRARVAEVRAFLEGLSAADFRDAGTRTISRPRWEGKTMAGADFFVEHAIPNFFFHLSHTYAILRHNGVPLGKADYLGQLSLQAPPV